MEEKHGLLDRCCCAYPPSILKHHVHWRHSVGLTISRLLQSRMEANKLYRNRFYEFFKATHFLALGFFIVFFFIHCDFHLTSCYIPTQRSIKTILTKNSGTISSPLSPSTAQHTSSPSSAPPSKVSKPKQSLPSSPTRQSGPRFQARWLGSPASMYSFASGNFQACSHTVCIPSQSAHCLHPEKWSSS